MLLLQDFASVKEVVLSGLTKTKRIFRFNKSDEQQVDNVLHRLNIHHLRIKILQNYQVDNNNVLIARA